MRFSSRCSRLSSLLAVGREQAKLSLALPRRFQSEETLHFPATQARVAQGVQQRLRLTERRSYPLHLSRRAAPPFTATV